MESRGVKRDFGGDSKEDSKENYGLDSANSRENSRLDSKGDFKGDSTKDSKKKRGDFKGYFESDSKDFGVDFKQDSIESNEYILVAGERRLRAIKLLGESQIECIIIDVETYRLRELALIENIQRRDLNAIELALCYEALIKEHNLTHEKLGERLSKSRVVITNTLRLLELSKEAQTLVVQGKLSQGHARALVGLSGSDEKVAIDSILGQNLNVRDTEKMVSRMKNRPNFSEDSKVDSNIESNGLKSAQNTQDSNDFIESKGVDSTQDSKGNIESKGKIDSKMTQSLQVLSEILAKNGASATISNNCLILKFDSHSTIDKIIDKLQKS
ncbi:ParB/RepB/Spo0J family partition protein [Helicobacter saguini]|uniref:ParB/RepB/Spo0J family partition protein n=2 Tax=Helicobacter saguini TaxID=1548018 RepID=A0A347VU88_9HELI|nr:ParB/RepB/Spo0J family partition protein [Helicobacter saguini]MWV66765.1 ParB/RepB/Spo0J family partition protein [Helicobacter saguini]MWV69116.1 ParB/RepB/Spo0J family partition protein [Helicobacter saguini]MWV71329.1 ParB/RepB/Spo0J family partition protein [Helicobacter saguini]TLD94240.1 ParB/RepB/Spo0J family partition protein [Helicobacter saguini]